MNDRTSKPKLQAYGAEIYAAWEHYGGKYPRMYRADEVDAEIQRLQKQIEYKDAVIAGMIQGLKDLAPDETTSPLRLATSLDAPWPLPTVLEELIKIAQIAERVADYPGRDSITIAIECGKGCLRNLRAALEQRVAVEPTRNHATAAPSDAVAPAPTPRGNLPNSLGTGGAGSHPAASSSEKASGEL
jgi:hypothetical protein